MLQRFSHVMMYVTDLDRAVGWYTDVLGFEARFVAAGQFASLNQPDIGCRLDLHPTEAANSDVGFGPIPYFEVTDLDGFLDALRARGVRVGEPRREGDSPRFVTIYDSEGNALGLEEPAAR